LVILCHASGGLLYDFNWIIRANANFRSKKLPAGQITGKYYSVRIVKKLMLKIFLLEKICRKGYTDSTAVAGEFPCLQASCYEQKGYTV